MYSVNPGRLNTRLWSGKLLIAMVVIFLRATIFVIIKKQRDWFKAECPNDSSILSCLGSRGLWLIDCLDSLEYLYLIIAQLWIHNELHSLLELLCHSYYQCTWPQTFHHFSVVQIPHDLCRECNGPYLDNMQTNSEIPKVQTRICEWLKVFN